MKTFNLFRKSNSSCITTNTKNPDSYESDEDYHKIENNYFNNFEDENMFEENTLLSRRKEKSEEKFEEKSEYDLTCKNNYSNSINYNDN